MLIESVVCSKLVFELEIRDVICNNQTIFLRSQFWIWILNLQA